MHLFKVPCSQTESLQTLAFSSVSVAPSSIDSIWNQFWSLLGQKAILRLWALEAVRTLIISVHVVS